MSVGTLHELLVDEVKDLYSAEKQIIKAIPKLVKGATSSELKEALTNHLAETQGQVKRLEEISKLLGTKPTGKKCAGMEGVLKEGAEVLEDTKKGSVRDAGIIAASQRVEHYEMAGYGSARDFAKQLALSDIAALLDQTLQEEKNADRELSSVSSGVNREAKLVGN